jgi:nucleotide-binding universal stress UspA family protein
MPKTLIVPVDGSLAGERALYVAQTLAARFDACAIVVMTASRDDEERGSSRAYLDTLGERAGNAPFRTDLVEHTDAAGAIVRAAENEADAVVCMATHGRGRLATPFLGSVATEVLRRVTAPVVLVGPRCETGWWHDPPRVVACWSGEPSNPILLPAREFAEALGSELWIASVFHPLDTHMAENPHAEFEPALRRIGPGIEAHLVPLSSDYPAGAIVASARELPATLLAMTTHARSGISRFALGSVTMQVVHRSPCPVLVVSGPR